MKKSNILILCSLCFLACKNKQDISEEKFDKIKWAINQDMDYPFRDKMINDLITNYKLHGIKRDSLVNLLGSPDRSDSSYLFYRIAQQRLGLIPLHTKTLVIKLDIDSSVAWRKIHE